MSTQTVSNVASALREVWKDQMTEALNDDQELYKELKSQEENYDGGRGLILYKTIETGRPMSLLVSSVANSETSALPTGDRSQYQQWTVTPVMYAGKIQLSQATILTGGSKYSIIADWVQSEMKNLMGSIIQRFGFDMHNDGTGAIAQINGSPSYSSPITTVVTDNPGNFWIQLYSYLGAYSARTGGSERAAYYKQVTGVLDDGVTIQVQSDTTGSWANDDFLFTYASATSGASNRTGIVGLLGAVNDDVGLASYQGITRATSGNQFANGKLYNVGAPLSYTSISAAISKLFQGTWGSRPKKLIAVTDFASLTWIEKVLAPQFRINTRKLEGGFEGSITYNFSGATVTFIPDRNAIATYCYFLDVTEIEIDYVKGSKWQWWAPENEIVRDPSGTLTVIAVLYAFVQMACWQPQRCLRMYGYTVPS